MTMAATAAPAAAAKQPVAKTTDKPEPAAAPVKTREPRPLSPQSLAIQTDGFVFREWVMRLPADVILQDLHDSPTIWRAIQSTQRALRPLDRVTAISFDQSWIVRDAIVAEADHQRVVLHIRPSDVVRLKSKTAEFQDETYVIRWAGAGFAAYRKADGVEVIPAHFNTLEACKAELFRQFYTTRRVA